MKTANILTKKMARPALAMSTALASLILPWAAAAQQAEGNPADGSTDAGEIIVTGSPIRDSIAKSLAAQRKADNIVNVISADTVGRFPDLTAAGALARLPGIAVQRDQGQERYVQVRGAPARWTSVSFDGLNVLGAEERIFRFDSVPAALISTVELNKTLLPEMPAEALAGRVNIRTYSALDNPGFHALLDGGYGFVDIGDGPQRQLAGRLSWSNDRFGVVLAGSHFMFEQQTSNAEPSYDDTGISSLRTTKYITERETNSLSGKIEFSPADGHRLTATSLYTEFLDHELRNQYTFVFDDGVGTRGFTSGDLVAVPVENMFSDANYKNTTWINMLRGDHELGAWRTNWTLAYVETETLQDLPAFLQTADDAALRPSLSYRLGEHGLPVLTLYDTVETGNGAYARGRARASLNQTAFTSERFDPRTFGSKSKSYTAKLDIARDWSSLGGAATLRIGGQFDDRKSVDPGRIALITPAGDIERLYLREAAEELGLPWTPEAMVTDKSWEERMNRGYSTNYVDNPMMRWQLDAIIAAAEAANAAGTGNYAVPRHNPALANSVKERIAAGYISNLWRWDRLSLVAGVRVEHSEIKAEGAAAVDSELQQLRLKNDDTFVFPSLHLNFDATNALKLRAAYVSGAARPSFSDQRATVSIDDSQGSEQVEGGNPYLSPERAHGIDASAEWYFGNAGLLSASGFYRDVKDVLFESTALVGDDRFNFGGIDRSNYEYTTIYNGRGGELYGVEFAYYHPWTFLPGVLSGLGFHGSVAFIDGSFETPDGRSVRFPGTSKRITNLALFYEKYGFSARLGYQHRTDWLDEVGNNPASDVYWLATERVDLSLRYQLTQNFTLYADINNLTDELGVRYDGVRARPSEVEQFGRRFLFGVRATF